MDILPPVVAAGTDVGVLAASWFDIGKGNTFNISSGVFTKETSHRGHKFPNCYQISNYYLFEKVLPLVLRLGIISVQ